MFEGWSFLEEQPLVNKGTECGHAQEVEYEDSISPIIFELFFIDFFVFGLF